MANLGEMEASGLTTEGEQMSITFQAAKVRKPLMAVSSVNDKGQMVLFHLKGSYLIPAHAPEVTTIRNLVAQAQGKVTPHRENGIFNMRVWHKSPDFTRPGK